MAYFWTKFPQTSIKIPNYEEKDGVVFYKIHVIVDDISWTVLHRYNDFCELHDELVNDHGVAKDILPSKKLIKSPEFIENRRYGLELYLQKVLKFLLLTMPRVFVEFLHFHSYDVFFILESLAKKFSENVGEKSHEFFTLEMHAISMCCGTLVPPDNYVSGRQYDITNVWDFCLQLRMLLIHGDSCSYGNSNINPNKLWYDFKNFKNIEYLNMKKVCLDSIKDLGNFRSNIRELILVHSNMTNLCQILQCDILHKYSFEKAQIWTNLCIMDLSSNSLTELDESIKLVPNLKVLILNSNRFKDIPDLRVLEQLIELSISENSIGTISRPIYQLLPNQIQDLNLSSNSISSLECFTDHPTLINLDLTSNKITDIKQVENLIKLSGLVNLCLNGNFISTIVDYRVRVLEYFGTTMNICLDNEQTTKDEIDKISIRKAIRILKENTPV